MAYFMLVVPANRQYLDVGLELSYLNFWHANAEFLVQQLAVPVPLQLPGEVPALHRALSSYTTHKEEVAFALEEKAQKKVHYLRATRHLRPLDKVEQYDGKPTSACKPPDDFALEEALGNVPAHDLPKFDDDNATGKTGAAVEQEHYSKPGLVGFLDLPPELQIDVLKRLDIEDFHPISLANAALCRLARVVLEERYRSRLGAWAGKQLICLGEKIKPGQFPLSPCGQAMEKMFSNIKKPSEQGNLAYARSTPVADEITKHWAKMNPIVEELPWVFRHRYQHPECRLSDPEFMVSITEQDPVIPPDLPELSVFYPQDQEWILRNLTTKELVRAGSIAIKCEDDHGPFITGGGFGRVVLIRTLWPGADSLDNLADVYGYDISHMLAQHRGPWAGHAFDITTMSYHTDTTKNEVWTDIGDEVRREMDAFIEEIARL